MSETQETPETNDGTWSGLKKTIIATLTTLITGGGAYLGTTIFNGDSDNEETKTEQVAPVPAAAPVINLNVDNSSKNMNNGGGGTTTIIREKTVEKTAPAEKKKEKKSETEDAPW
jgi:hypothetical protein